MYDVDALLKALLAMRFGRVSGLELCRHIGLIIERSWYLKRCAGSLYGAESKTHITRYCGLVRYWRNWCCISDPRSIPRLSQGDGRDLYDTMITMSDGVRCRLKVVDRVWCTLDHIMEVGACACFEERGCMQVVIKARSI